MSEQEQIPPEETPQARAERQARERAEDLAIEKHNHETWRAMERGRLAAFTQMAAALDKELGENVEPTSEAANWAISSRERVLNALATLMLPPEEPSPRPLDRLMDGLADAARELAANPSFVQGVMAAASARGIATAAPVPAPAVIDPAAPDRASAINSFIQDCADRTKVSDETVVALSDFLASVAQDRKIGSFAEPSKP